MAPKLFQLLSFLFLFLSPIAFSKRDSPSDNKPSPFHFINQLEGCHKGKKTQGLNQLKRYLQKFGYLQRLEHANSDADDDDFDDALESAIKTYQENYRIKPTGVLDAATVSMMTEPRCGVPDIINGINTMQPHRQKLQNSSIHVVSRYAFFPGNRKWPPSKTHLTYGFLSDIPTNAITPVENAFGKWASATQRFTFSRAQIGETPDLKIGFFRGDHGDGSPFDGPGGTLAHAFAPTDGRLHYDEDEKWHVGAAPNAFDLETVGLHEIGHLLGLGHTSVAEAIMFARISAGATKDLHPDDLEGIRVLYST